METDQGSAWEKFLKEVFPDDTVLFEFDKLLGAALVPKRIHGAGPILVIYPSERIARACSRKEKA